MFTKVGEFNGKKIFQIWKDREASTDVNGRPLVAFGLNKARTILAHVDDIQRFVEAYGNGDRS